MAVPHRARNSLILDYLRRQEQPQPLVVPQAQPFIRRPFSVPLAITPAIPSPVLPIQTPQRGRLDSFAGLSLPPLPSRFQPTIKPQVDKTDKIIELLSQLVSTDKVRNTPLYDYKVKQRSFAGTDSSQQVCNADIERDALMIISTSGAPGVYVMPVPGFNSTTGWSVIDTHVFMLSKETDGLWVNQAWYAFIMSGISAVVVELVRIYKEQR